MLKKALSIKHVGRNKNKAAPAKIGSSQTRKANGRENVNDRPREKKKQRRIGLGNDFQKRSWKKQGPHGPKKKGAGGCDLHLQSSENGTRNPKTSSKILGKRTCLQARKGNLRPKTKKADHQGKIPPQISEKITDRAPTLHEKEKNFTGTQPQKEKNVNMAGGGVKGGIKPRGSHRPEQTRVSKSKKAKIQGGGKGGFTGTREKPGGHLGPNKKKSPGKNVEKKQGNRGGEKVKPCKKKEKIRYC